MIDGDKTISKLINRINFGALGKCGFREAKHGYHADVRVEERRRAVMARMARIPNGWRK